MTHKISTRNRLKGYLFGRAVVLSAILLLTVIFLAKRGSLPASSNWLFLLTAASFTFSLSSSLLLRANLTKPLVLHIQPAWDVAYVSALIFVSGGAFSPFAALYPLVIIGAAILLSRRAALVTASASSLAYGILVDLQFYDILRPINPFPLPEVGPTKLAFQLLFNIVAFYAVAFLSGYLAEELKRTGDRLEEAKAEVLDLEHLKESILLSLTSGLTALDSKGREVFHNRAAEELLARTGIFLKPGMNLNDSFDLGGGDRKEVFFEEAGVLLGYTVSPLCDREGRPRGSILIFQDLTQVKKLEEDLRRADRLAAVGRLAAGLAHEIRNPLASLSGSTEVLRQNLAPEKENAELFDIILRETDRLNRLVTNFLHYARPEKGECSQVNLHNLAAETAFFFSQGEGKGRFNLINLAPEDLEIQADKAQLEQLFLNLFRNSIEAASDNLTITVDAYKKKQSVYLKVKDDGPGMPPEVASRAFEPFFTRKSGGTGLGLATVHGIIKNHGGYINLETAPGRGSTFLFTLPNMPISSFGELKTTPPESKTQILTAASG